MNTLKNLNSLVEEIELANRYEELLDKLYSIIGPYAWLDKEGNLHCGGAYYKDEDFQKIWSQVKALKRFDDSE